LIQKNKKLVVMHGEELKKAEICKEESEMAKFSFK